MTTSGYQVSFYAKGLSWMSFVVETVRTGWTSLLASLIFSWSSTAKWPCSGPGFKLKLMRLLNVFLNMALFAIVLVVLVFMPGYCCILAVFLRGLFFVIERLYHFEKVTLRFHIWLDFYVMWSLFAAVSMHYVLEMESPTVPQQHSICEEVRVKTAQYGFSRQDSDGDSGCLNSRNPKFHGNLRCPPKATPYPINKALLRDY